MSYEHRTDNIRKAKDCESVCVIVCTLKLLKELGVNFSTTVLSFNTFSGLMHTFPNENFKDSIGKLVHQNKRHKILYHDVTKYLPKKEFRKIIPKKFKYGVNEVN